MELVRLQKFLANSGVCSRRNAEQLILDGKIKVNGIVVSELGLKIDIEKDVVTYNNKEVKKIDKKIYILLNKPIGYVTTVKEQFGRPTVIDLVKEVNSNLLPVGRLDMYTSGAIILTNDGDFINKVTHPRNEVNKTYNATLSETINNFVPAPDNVETGAYTLSGRPLDITFDFSGNVQERIVDELNVRDTKYYGQNTGVVVELVDAEMGQKVADEVADKAEEAKNKFHAYTDAKK